MVVCGFLNNLESFVLLQVCFVKLYKNCGDVISPLDCYPHNRVNTVKHIDTATENILIS